MPSFPREGRLLQAWENWRLLCSACQAAFTEHESGFPRRAMQTNKRGAFSGTGDGVYLFSVMSVRRCPSVQNDPEGRAVVMRKWPRNMPMKRREYLHSWPHSACRQHPSIHTCDELHFGAVTYKLNTFKLSAITFKYSMILTRFLCPPPYVNPSLVYRVTCQLSPRHHQECPSMPKKKGKTTTTKNTGSPKPSGEVRQNHLIPQGGAKLTCWSVMVGQNVSPNMCFLFAVSLSPDMVWG